jgi:hypothetical protein
MFGTINCISGNTTPSIDIIVATAGDINIINMVVVPATNHHGFGVMPEIITKAAHPAQA